MKKWWRFVTGFYASQLSRRDDDKSLEQLLVEAKDYFDAVLPRKADADTRLDSVEVSGTVFTLHSTLFSVDQEDLEDIDFIGAMQPILQQQAHRYRRLRRLLEKGGYLRYTYRDRNGESVGEVVLNDL